MMFDLVLRGGTLVSHRESVVADIGIAEGRIQQIGDLGGAGARREIVLEGKSILPGLIDTQVHFREPGLEHKEDLESGSRAAVMGGVTTFFEMPNTNPVTTTEEALNDKLRRAKGRLWSNYSFFVGAGPDNVSELARLEQLPGTPGVKIFMGSSTGPLLIDGDDLLEQVLANGVRPCPIHAEDEPRLRSRKGLLTPESHVREHPFLRDPEAARLATERVIRLSDKTGRPVHILHISTADELPLLRAAKARGSKVTCEVTPQHMTLDASMYETLGTHLQMNPPVRDESHREAIFAAWQEGLFDVVGSDHAPHTQTEKALPYPQSPSGMPGVQTSLPILLKHVQAGAVSLHQVVEMTSRRPAELYGIADRGEIREGYWADLVVIDPASPFVIEKSWLQSKCGWSQFEGWTGYGKPHYVLINGCVAVDDGQLAAAGAGAPTEFLWKTT
jgi:dihydroorotase